MRLGWFSTGRDEAARDLLDTIMRKKEEGEIDVEISFVFCNWEPGEEPHHKDFEEREKFFRLARSYGIPLVSLSWKRFRPDLKKRDMEAWRSEYGKEMRKSLSGYSFDLGILAGYMLWVDDESCRRYKLINLHPALPGGPRGTWQEVIWQLIREEADWQGAMMHLCTAEWDRGPPLTYCKFSLRTPDYVPLWQHLKEKLRIMSLDEIREKEGETEPLFRKIRRDGEIRELPLITYTIKLFSEGKVHIKGEELYEDGTLLTEPYDLTPVVESALAREEFRR